MVWLSLKVLYQDKDGEESEVVTESSTNFAVNLVHALICVGQAQCLLCHHCQM